MAPEYTCTNHLLPPDISMVQAAEDWQRADAANCFEKTAVD